MHKRGTFQFLLNIVPEEDQVVHREWLHFYDGNPMDCRLAKYDRSSFNFIRIGVDLASTKNPESDCTAMVPVMLFGNGKDMEIYVLPQIVNRKMLFPETVEMCKELNRIHYYNGVYPIFIIEDVGYQKALAQQINYEGIHKTKLSRPGNSNKRERLTMTTSFIRNGKILFPRKGCEELISQLVNFGVEKHDDLADAFSMVILDIIANPPKYIGFA